MRTTFATVAAAILVAAACSPSGTAEIEANDASAMLDREAGELSLVSVVRAPDGSCTYRWNGQPIAENAAPDRAFQTVDAEVQRLGGPQNINSDFRVVFEAPEDAPYSCFSGTLTALAGSGFSQIALRFAGRGPGADRIIQVAFPTAGQTSRPYAVLDLRENGDVLWNGQPASPEAVREFLTRTVLVPADGVSDGRVIIIPEPATRFAAIHELVGTASSTGTHTVSIQPTGEAPGAAPPPEIPAAPPPPQIPRPPGS